MKGLLTSGTNRGQQAVLKFNGSSKPIECRGSCPHSRSTAQLGADAPRVHLKKLKCNVCTGKHGQIAQGQGNSWYGECGDLYEIADDLCN